MKRPLLAMLLVCASIRAHADLANPYPLTNTRYSTASRVLTAAVASDGRDFVVAMQTPYDIRAMQIIAGEAHRAFAEPVLTRYLGGAAPAIVWTGAHYLVAGTRGNAIVGRLLDRSGRPAEPEFTILSRGGAPRLATNGSRIAMAYSVDETPDKLHAAILDLRGRALIADIAVDSGDAFRYDVASNGTNFRLAWSMRSSVKSVTMSEGGQLAPVVEVLEGNVDTTPAVRVVAAGTSYVVAYRRGLNQIVAGTIGALFTVAETGDGRLIRDHALSWNGADIVASYVTNGVYSNRLRRDGSPLTSPQEIEGNDASLSTSMASAGSTSLLTWIEYDSGPPFSRSILRAQFLGSGAPSGPKVTLSNAAADQTRTAAASGSLGALVAWVEENGSNRSIMAGLAGADGTWTEIGNITGPLTERITTLLATDGEGFAIAATVGSNHVMYRFAPNGTPIGSPVPLPSQFHQIDGLAWNGTDFAVVGRLTPGGALGAVRISAGGVVIQPIVTIHPGGAFNASISSNGVEFLVTYDVPGPCFPPCTFTPDPRAMRLGPTLMQAGPEIRFGGDGIEPVAAWNGAEYLVVMRAGDSIIAKRLTAQGEIRDVNPIVIHTANVERTRPRVTWIGSRYAVTWRTVSSTLAGTSALAYVDIAANVTPAVAFDVESVSHTDPIPVRMTIGQLAIVTTSASYDAPHHGSERVFFRWADTYLAPAAPQLIKAEHFQGRIALQWTTVPLATGYRFEFKAGDQPWKEGERFFAANAGSVEVSGFRIGVPYRFRVRAWSRAGVSHYSNELVVYVSPRPRGL